MVMGGGCCVGTAAWEQAMILVMVRGLQRIGAVAAVVLTLVMVPCGGVPVAVGVGWSGTSRSHPDDSEGGAAAAAALTGWIEHRNCL